LFLPLEKGVSSFRCASGPQAPTHDRLDISSSSVKLVELGQNGAGEYVLERFGSELR
jgi:hypothetical protein